ncbi:hypothetical protein ACFVU3_08595 [Streptomyces sp. NPDC058052]|uniref:hypothetical protein n=1 Tax=Streptomyces sp. NPDC058052 TaxID=3346316 RepID=UPI0036EB19A5
MTTPRRPGGTPAEDRLRAALAARAALLTHRDLRPAAPPEGRTWGTRRVCGAAFAAVVVAAALAVLTLLPTGTSPAPVPPAHRPSRDVTPSAPPSPPPTRTPGPAAPSVAHPTPVP